MNTAKRNWSNSSVGATQDSAWWRIILLWVCAMTMSMHFAPTTTLAFDISYWPAHPEEPDSTDPLRFDFGTGPATLVGADYLEPAAVIPAGSALLSSVFPEAAPVTKATMNPISINLISELFNHFI